MSQKLPHLSIIIPWCDRPELQMTLARNAALLAAHEVVVVNCGGTPDRLRALLADLALPTLRWLDLPAGRFNKSLALNLGVHIARAERVFLLDADILLDEDLVDQALAGLVKKCFVTVERVVESKPGRGLGEPHVAEIAHLIELVSQQGRRVVLETNRVRLQDSSRSGPGLILLSRRHFVQVNGMNSALESWGWEDLDLLMRLQLVLGLGRRQVGSVVHLTHGDNTRALQGRTRAASQEANFSACLANYSLGYHLGTYTEDVAAWRERLVIHNPGPALGDEPG